MLVTTLEKSIILLVHEISLAYDGTVFTAKGVRAMEQVDLAEAIYDFEGFTLYAGQRRVFKGEQQIHIPDLAIRVLIFLIEKRHRLVKYNELYLHLWNDRVVEPNNMATHVSTLRRKLQRHLILTIATRGFQFVGNVTMRAGSLLPPVKSRINLVRCAVGFIPTSVELNAVVTLIDRHRLVVLIGPFGVGKSRAANELGWRLHSRFSGGVLRIDLAAESDSDGVMRQTMHVLQVESSSGDATTMEPIVQRYGTLPILLIFDNCDRVLPAVAAVAEELLHNLPGVAIIVTSRERLPGAAQMTCHVNPLAVPVSGEATPSASDLFVEYGRVANENFSPPDRNAREVVELCRRLDGLPLMLELAAAKLSRLRISGLHGLLDKRLDVLDKGSREGDKRHLSPRDALDWGYEGLAADDRRFFARLGGFPGTFSFEGAIAVAGPRECREGENIKAFLRLIEKSLVTLDDGKDDEPPRYHLLETIKLYAGEKLEVFGESNDVDEQHIRFYVELFKKAEVERETMSDDQWLRDYGWELDNVRKGLNYTLAAADRVNDAIALGGASGRLWERLNLRIEGRGYLDRLVLLLNVGTPDADAARLLKYAGILWRDDDRLQAMGLLERSVAFYRKAGGPHRLDLASALGLLGDIYLYLGRHEPARTALTEALEILAKSDRKKALWNTLNGLGSLAVTLGKIDQALHYYGLALDLARELKDAVRENTVLYNLAEVDFSQGAFTLAVERAQEAATGFRTTGQSSYLVRPLVNLTTYHIVLNDYAAARLCAEEALSLWQATDGYWLRLCLQQWALIGAREGRFTKAARLIGFVDAGKARAGEERQPNDRQVYDPLSQILNGNLTARDILACTDEGRHWAADYAIEFTLKQLMPAPTPK